MVRAEAIRRDGGCVATTLVPEVTCGGILEVDEIQGRGVRPGGHLVAGNTQVLCSRHHQWKTEHPLGAQMRGLALPSWAGDDERQEAAQLRVWWAHGNATHPSWWSDSERDAWPIPNNRRLHSPPLEGGPL